MKDIQFQSDGLTLKGNLFYPEKLKEKNPAILFIHGWTSDKSRSFQYAKDLIKLGYVVMLFDMRGHGVSEGDINTYTPKQFLKDCVEAYDYLVSLPEVDSQNISAVGSSFGGYLVSILSKQKILHNVVLRVPADYKKESFESLQVQNGGKNPGVSEWRTKPRKFDETLALEAIHDFMGNILIIECEKDTLVPHQVIQNYVDAIQDKLKMKHIVVKNAPHSIKDGPFKDEVSRILVEWFKDRNPFYIDSLI